MAGERCPDCHSETCELMDDARLDDARYFIVVAGCRARQVTVLRARLALAEAVIEAARPCSGIGVRAPNAATRERLQAALQAFDSVSPGSSGGDSTGKEPTNSGR